MGRPGKYSFEEVASMYDLIKQYASSSGSEIRMTISDGEMCAIIMAQGYNVNEKYVERLRKAMGIAPRGREKHQKAAYEAVLMIIKDYAPVEGDAWRLSVSDAVMADIIQERGYDVNKRYIERARKALGIQACGRRPEAPPLRPIRGGDVLAALHERDVYMLSVRRGKSRSMYGASGTDAYTAGIGAHTLGYEEALARKERQIARLREAALKRAVKGRAKAIDKGGEEKEEGAGRAVPGGCYTRGRGGARRSLGEALFYQSI